MHDQPNENFPNLKLKNLYGNSIIGWMKKHVTLKFKLAHMNSILVEIWGASKLSSATIAQEDFNKTQIPPFPRRTRA